MTRAFFASLWHKLRDRYADRGGFLTTLRTSWTGTAPMPASSSPCPSDSDAARCARTAGSGDASPNPLDLAPTIDASRAGAASNLHQWQKERFAYLREVACRTAAVIQGLRNCERSLFMIEHNLVVDAPNF
jgi:hypothetical protein